MAKVCLAPVKQKCVWRHWLTLSKIRQKRLFLPIRWFGKLRRSFGFGRTLFSCDFFSREIIMLPIQVFTFPISYVKMNLAKKKKKKLNLGDFFSRNCKAYSIINSNAANVTACLFTWNFFQPYSSFPWCALIWRIFHQIKTEMKKKITIWQKTLWKITLKGYYAEDLFVKPHNKNLQILTLQMDEFLPLLGGIFGWFTLWAKNFVKSKRSVEKREIHTHFSPFNAKILILSVEKQEIHS